MPRPRRVGHVVLNVRDVATSAKFYKEVLGFETSVERAEGTGIFLTCGKIHHDIALFLAAPDAAPVTPGGLGLNHIALQVEDFDTLTEYYHHLEKMGVTIDHTTDHNMTLSIYINDPDGNGLELFCNSQADPAEGLAVMRTPGRKNKELIFV